MRISLLILVVLAVNLVKGQTSLQSKIDSLITSSTYFKDVQLGISVRDTETGDLMAEIEKDKPLTPASSLKLITTLTALEILGHNFRYDTRLSYDGTLHQNGILEGNIYIEGAGDPSLGSDRIPGVPSTDSLMANIVQDIKAAGITCVEGKIIADVSSFYNKPVCASWLSSDLGSYYAAGVWGLNVNENAYKLWYNCNGSIGSNTQIAYYEPHIPNLAFNNDVKIGKKYSGDNTSLYGGPYTKIKWITGTLPKSKSLILIKGAMPDPAHFFTFTLKNELQKKYLESDSIGTQFDIDQNKHKRVKISNYLSPDMVTLIKHTNEASINMYAESLLRTVGNKIFQSGTDEAGINAILQQLHLMGCIDTTFVMEDGSGLSTKNQMSPDFMSRFLVGFLRNNDKNLVKNVIPAVGVDGTVKKLMKNSEAKGKLWAKSGSMQDVLSYSGYCETLSGKFIAFSIILNTQFGQGKKPKRAELEKILEAIYRFC